MLLTLSVKKQVIDSGFPCIFLPCTVCISAASLIYKWTACMGLGICLQSQPYKHTSQENVHRWHGDETMCKSYVNFDKVNYPSCGSLEGILFKAPRIEAPKNLSMEKSCSMANKLACMGLLRLGSFKARNSDHIDNGTNRVASDFICSCVLFHIFQLPFKMDA